MVGWLKFYFLGFFQDKYGKEAVSRSALNLLLSLLLTLVLLCGGIMAGYSASFSAHYRNADEFRSFLYSTFAEGDSRIDLTFHNGKLNAQISGAQHVNTFQNANKDDNSQYLLIVDTRPAATTYDDFLLVCKDANGTEVSYEDYRNLPEQGQKNGSIQFVYTGNTLDVAAKRDQYVAYLDSLSNEASHIYNATVAAAYGEVKHKFSVNEITQEQFNDEIYALYAKNYYPDYSAVEIYGNAPTLRTYYMQAELIDGVDKYLILLDDLALCSFTTNKDIIVTFGSYYSGINDTIISSASLTASAMRKNVDAFIAQCFKSSGGFNFLVTLMNIGKFMLLLVAAILVLALIVFALCKALKLEFGCKYFGALKIIGGYLLYTAVITFVVEMLLSFTLSRSMVFLVSEIVFGSVLLLRTLALFVAELIRKSKNQAEPSNDDLAQPPTA